MGIEDFDAEFERLKKEFAEKYKNDESTSNEPSSTIQEHKKSGSLEKGAGSRRLTEGFLCKI